MLLQKQLKVLLATKREKLKSSKSYFTETTWNSAIVIIICSSFLY